MTGSGGGLRQDGAGGSVATDDVVPRRIYESCASQ